MATEKKKTNPACMGCLVVGGLVVVFATCNAIRTDMMDDTPSNVRTSISDLPPAERVAAQERSSSAKQKEYSTAFMLSVIDADGNQTKAAQREHIYQELLDSIEPHVKQNETEIADMTTHIWQENKKIGRKDSLETIMRSANTTMDLFPRKSGDYADIISSLFVMVKAGADW